MSHAKQTCVTRWQVALPPGVNRLHEAHDLVFGASASGAVHAWSRLDGSLRYSRGETGLMCEGFAVVGETLLVVLAKRAKGEVWSKTVFAFDAATGAEHGRTELDVDGAVGSTCVTSTQRHAFISLVKSGEITGIDDQAQEDVLIALETGLTVTNLIGAGEMVVALVAPHQGLRGYLLDETLVLSVDGAMPVAWSADGLLASVNGLVRCFDAKGVERWRRDFDVSARMALVGPLVIAVDHLGMVHALDASNGESKWSVTSGAKKPALLNPVVSGGYAWVLNAMGKVVAFDVLDGRKAFAPNEAFAHSRALLAGDGLVYVHREVDGHDSLTAFEVRAQ